ncbi:hypothetical protein HanIR_Chr04g0174001 [Helianthus annuus]|nr:hypothetical protein HanIR_Chr04g0174001 [Helianthus annuus]
MIRNFWEIKKVVILSVFELYDDALGTCKVQVSNAYMHANTPEGLLERTSDSASLKGLWGRRFL